MVRKAKNKKSLKTNLFPPAPKLRKAVKPTTIRGKIARKWTQAVSSTHREQGITGKLRRLGRFHLKQDGSYHKSMGVLGHVGAAALELVTPMDRTVDLFWHKTTPRGKEWLQTHRAKKYAELVEKHKGKFVFGKIPKHEFYYKGWRTKEALLTAGGFAIDAVSYGALLTLPFGGGVPTMLGALRVLKFTKFAKILKGAKVAPKIAKTAKYLKKTEDLVDLKEAAFSFTDGVTESGKSKDVKEKTKRRLNVLKKWAAKKADKGIDKISVEDMKISETQGYVQERYAPKEYGPKPNNHVFDFELEGYGKKKKKKD